jgi:hypothetical protein
MIKIADMILEELKTELNGEIADPVAALRGRVGQLLERMAPRRTFADGTRGYLATAQTTIDVVVGQDPNDPNAAREHFEFPPSEFEIQVHDPVLTLNGALRLDLEIRTYRAETISQVLFPGQPVALAVGRAYDSTMPPSIGRLEIPLGVDFGRETVKSHQMIYLVVETPIGVLHNPDAAHMYATIDQVPPVGTAYVQEGIVAMADVDNVVKAAKVATTTSIVELIPES